jgi:hypothetical protein
MQKFAGEVILIDPESVDIVLDIRKYDDSILDTAEEVLDLALLALMALQIEIELLDHRP